MRFRDLRHITSALAALLLAAAAWGQVPVEEPDYGVSRISPRWFGPYAFPVPDLLEGKVRPTLHAELGADAVAGRLTDEGDFTSAATFRFSAPLWTDRASVSVWGEMHEWYSDSRQVRQARRVSEGYPLKGNDSGNVYFSLDLQILKETQKRPGVALRAATLTATGDKYEVARHYDAPGYFFDLSAGKNLVMSRNASLRLSATSGFVCWQIDRGRQNDALLLGAKASLRSGIVSISAEYGTYLGRESRKDPDVSGDRPSALTLRADARLGRVSPFIYLRHGGADWPFELMRAGVAVDLDILKQ